MDPKTFERNQSLLQEFQHFLLSCDRSASTIENYNIVFRKFLRTFPCDIRFAKVVDLAEFISEPSLSSSTLHQRYSCFKRLYEWMIENEKVLINPVVKINSPKVVKGLPTRIMTVHETMKMLDSVPPNKNKPSQYRNRLIMELLYSCSLRRGEVSALDIDDYDPSTRSLRIRGATTKTRGGRLLPVGKIAAEMLETYLKEVRPPNPSKALFINKFRRRLEPISITAIVKKVREETGIKTNASSHSYRKSSATHMLRNGGSLIQVSRLLGHTDISATEVYTKVYPKDIIKMHKSHHPREREKGYALPELLVPKYIYGGDKLKTRYEPDAPPKKKKLTFFRHDEIPPVPLEDLSQIHQGEHPREEEESQDLPQLNVPKYTYAGDHLKTRNETSNRFFIDIQALHDRQHPRSQFPKEGLPELRIPAFMTENSTSRTFPLIK